MELYAANVLAQVQSAYHAAPPLAYIIVAFGTTLLGNLVAIPALLLGFDGTLGSKGFVFIPLAVLAGHLFGDIVWFTLGRGLSETQPGEWIRKQLPQNKRIEKFFETGSVYILAFSKLFAAPTVPILFLLGWYRTEPHKYMRLSLLSAGVWFLSLIAFCLVLYSGLVIVF